MARNLEQGEVEELISYGDSAYGSSDEEEKTCPVPKKCLYCCGGCCCCFIILIVVLMILVAKAAGEEFVRKHLQWSANITTCETSEGEWTDPPILAEVLLGQQPVYKCLEGHGYMTTPANISAVYDPLCMTDKFQTELADFNKDADWKLVSFPSRRGKHGQEDVTVTAWWLPVKQNKAPRIVVQHGNNVNFNDRTVQVVAYLLRSLGFACLLPNLRDHGTSGKSDHDSVGWGYDYYLDTLGAWDYAVKDPDGILGGSVDKNQVGLLGFSMGGFIVSTAFGFEPDVPGAWVDSGVFEPEQILTFKCGEAGIGFLSGLAWSFAKSYAAPDLLLRTPANTMVQPGCKERPLAVTQGASDTSVPPDQSQQLVKLVSGECYDVKEYYEPDYQCDWSFHCTMHLWKPHIYREKLCTFWTSVFGMDEKQHCVNVDLPDLEGNASRRQ